MRPALRLHQCLLYLVFTGAWLAVAGWGLAQTAPPADGILDETRALTPEIHRQLAEELKQFTLDMKCDAWIKASSFISAGVNLRRQAQMTRREWSPARPAVLMAYDRATNGSALSFAPEMWERYPAAELVEIMQDARRIMLDTKLTLEERLAMATRLWIDRLRVMEAVRLKQSLWIQRSEKKFVLTLPAVLAVGAVITAILGFIARRRSARADRRFLFPDVQVGMRFGAAYGGGVTAEIKTHVSAH